MKTSHYPSTSLCRKLKDSGFSKTELNYYSVDNTNWFMGIELDGMLCRYKLPCPSIAELLDELPQRVKDRNGYYWDLNIFSFPDVSYKYRVIYSNGGQSFGEDFLGTLPNALSEMWLFLKENNYLTK